MGRLSGGLLSGGLLSRATDFGFGNALIRLKSLGVYSLGVYSLGVYSLGVYSLSHGFGILICTHQARSLGLSGGLVSRATDFGPNYAHACS